MTDEVPNLRPSVVKDWIAIVISVASLIGTAAWMAAKYPDRSEFTKIQEAMWQMQRSSAVTEERVGRLLKASDEGTKEQLNRIEAKQDGQRRK